MPATAQDAFLPRHLGPRPADLAEMLQVVRAATLDELIGQTVPASIRTGRPLELGPTLAEHEVLGELRRLGSRNRRVRAYIGMGYAEAILPAVILRNILENPGWYTAYTPYQAEISQGRLEALLNFQTMTMDLCGMEVANASLLDEATAAAEAMHMFAGLAERSDAKVFFVSELCHPQTIAVVRTRASAQDIDVVVGDHATFAFDDKVFGALVQYPATDGKLFDYRGFCEKAHAHGARVAVAADLLALALLVPPGEFGADAAVGNAQRFGLPLGYGGPHAAFFATRKEYTRRVPGRLVGVSRDARGHTALRLALQTREQHIRREKATSNICTSQVLPAVMASMFAVYHGAEGVRAIATRVAQRAATLAHALSNAGLRVAATALFDTVRVDATAPAIAACHARAEAVGICLRQLSPTALTITLDEATTSADVETIVRVMAPATATQVKLEEVPLAIPAALVRTSPFLRHPVFSAHRSETEMLRYMRRLQAKDLSLADSMIPLGSCTMKLNATAEMLSLTWPEWNGLHPFVPAKYAEGYVGIVTDLEMLLAEITGFEGVSLQPNAGAQGEYAGLLVIRKYQSSRGQEDRDVCLIPASAHGTNPASAVMAGLRVVQVACDAGGNVDLADLTAKATQNSRQLAALMLTYPSTHGVFEEDVQKLCEVVHQHGGQVYMDGANMNGLVGLCRPAELGADVCHVNLHKTFASPHGGGGPGAGPIAVASHLVPFLPGHPIIQVGSDQAIGAVAAAPWGSANILLPAWAYARLMGAAGLTEATRYAILNANYVAERLHEHFPVVYRGKQGRVAHECIVDLRPLKKSAGIEADDVAKRLMDYGFHAPTMSFPIPGTLMIEPTESESKAELDRFCDAMIAIRQEIREIETGMHPRDDNLLKNAPHTADTLLAAEWTHPYPRERAAYPLPHLRQHKYWPPVARLDNVLGDRQFACACPS
ncbi:MAG: aminomethyl-transferring glycine dehydrogenase [Deltaproteobacteria bacterium]|nr:aminomethyl-transferring glycine dehydrogenase [Deltaproteobacteria bacterium]